MNKHRLNIIISIFGIFATVVLIILTAEQVLLIEYGAMESMYEPIWMSILYGQMACIILIAIVVSRYTDCIFDDAHLKSEITLRNEINRYKKSNRILNERLKSLAISLLRKNKKS